MVAYGHRIMRYEINGSAVRPIRGAVDINFTCPLVGPPALTFRVNKKLNGSLPDYFEVAYEYKVAAGDWVEPDNARFIAIKQSYDDATEDDFISVTCVDIATFYLRKERMPESVQVVQAPGSAIGQAVVAAQARGWAPGLTFDFDASEDSSGNPWSSDEALVLNYSFGTSIDSVLAQFIDGEQLVIRRVGRTIRVWEAFPAIGGAIGFPEIGRAPVARPVEKSIEDLTTVVRVKGESAAYEVALTGAPASFGRLVTTVDGGLATSGQATKIGTVAGRNINKVQTQFTVTEEASATLYAPFLNFQIGSSEWVRSGTDEPATQRKLVEIQVRGQADGAIFFDYTFDFLLRDKVAQVVGNTNTAPNPVGTTPIPPSVGGGGGGGYYAFVTNLTGPGGLVSFAFEESPGSSPPENVAAVGTNVNGLLSLGSRVLVLPVENSVDGVNWQIIDLVSTEVPDVPPPVTPPAGTATALNTAVWGSFGVWRTDQGWRVFRGQSTGGTIPFGTIDAPLMPISYTAGIEQGWKYHSKRDNLPGGTPKPGLSFDTTGLASATESSGSTTASRNTVVYTGFMFNNSNDPSKIWSLNAAGTAYVFKDSYGLCQISTSANNARSTEAGHYLLPAEVRPSSKQYLMGMRSSTTIADILFANTDGTWNAEEQIPKTGGIYLYLSADSTLTWTTVNLQNEYVHGTGALNSLEMGQGPLQYCIHPDGFVLWRGIAHSGLSGQPANFVLPEEIRPAFRVRFPHPVVYQGISDLDPTGFFINRRGAPPSETNVVYGGMVAYMIA